MNHQQLAAITRQDALRLLGDFFTRTTQKLGGQEMKWVPFEKAEQAEQAEPGAKMRRLHRAPLAGRPSELQVLYRERDRLLGNIIRFTDGSYIRIVYAKGEYEVKE